jgi:hypothetical protein
MTIAFIGVQGLINKVVNTCTKLSETSNQTPKRDYRTFGAFESFGSYGPQVSYSPLGPRGCEPAVPGKTTPAWAKQPSPTSSTPRVSTDFLTPLVPAPSIPLKVMRLMEKQSSPLNAGRMVMSGRFADVCAELDRLTERQSQQISLRKS